MIEWRWEEGTLSKRIFQFSLQIGNDDMTKCSTQMLRFDVLFEGVEDVVIHFKGCAWDVIILFFVSWENIVETGKEAISFRWTCTSHWHSTISWAHQRIEKRRRAVAINIFCFHSFTSSSSSIVFISFFFLPLWENSTNPGERQSE